MINIASAAHDDVLVHWMPSSGSNKRRRKSIGSCSSDCPPEGADEAGKSEPHFPCVFTGCTCVYGAKLVLVKHLKEAHSQCVATDDVVTRARMQYGLGQCQFRNTFVAVNTVGSLHAHGPRDSVCRRPGSMC